MCSKETSTSELYIDEYVASILDTALDFDRIELSQSGWNPLPSVSRSSTANTAPEQKNDEYPTGSRCSAIDLTEDDDNDDITITGTSFNIPKATSNAVNVDSTDYSDPISLILGDKAAASNRQPNFKVESIIISPPTLSETGPEDLSRMKQELDRLSRDKQRIERENAEMKARLLQAELENENLKERTKCVICLDRDIEVMIIDM